MSTDNITTPAPLDDDLFGLGSDDILVEDRDYGSIFPTISYIVGDPSKTKNTVANHGGFFMDLQNVTDPDLMKGLGWEDYTRVTKDGEEIPGLAIRDLTGFIVSTRRAWTVELAESDLRQVFAQSQYDEAEQLGSPRGLCHVLLVMDGAEDLGPFMLSFRGMVAKEMAGQNGVISDFGRRIVMRARSLSAQKGKRINFPTCMFSLTIGPARDDKGKAIHTVVGQGKATSKVVMPTWVDAPKGVATAADVRSRFCGKARSAVLQGHVADAEVWRAKFSEEGLSKSKSAPSSDSGSTVAGGAADGTPTGNTPGF